jgi:hypothetical protein
MRRILVRWRLDRCPLSLVSMAPIAVGRLIADCEYESYCRAPNTFKAAPHMMGGMVEDQQRNISQYDYLLFVKRTNE